MSRLLIGLLMLAIGSHSIAAESIWLLQQDQKTWIDNPGRASSLCNEHGFNNSINYCFPVPTMDGIHTWREEDRQRVAATLETERKTILALVAALEQRIEALETEVHALRED